MAGTYFCFSDECGDYKPQMTNNQLRIHPYYVRTTLIINSNEWKKLNTDFKELKKKYSLPLSRELKWANVWSLRHYQKRQQPIPAKLEIKYLEEYDYHTLIDFVEEVLALINHLKHKKIIATYTKNISNNSTSEKAILQFHLQEHMQRIEMELQSDEENLGVLFFDPVSKDKNELLRQLYYELFEDGDFIKQYKSIKDSLNIENSHHSVGIQIADYISGTFNSVLRTSTDNNYLRGISMFFEYVHPNLRRRWDGAIQGYGIREVPKDTLLRKKLAGHINNLKSKQLSKN